MEVKSYLLEEQIDMQACLSAIAPEEMECQSLLVEMYGVNIDTREFLWNAKQVQKKFPKAHIIGGASDAVISGGNGKGEGLSLTFVKFEATEIDLFTMLVEENETTPAKDICLNWLNKRHDLVALHVLAIGHVNAALRIFDDKITVPVFGGLLGNTDYGKKNGYLYVDGEFLDHAILVVALCSQKLSVRVEKSSGWQALGPTMTVTGLKDPYTIAELDGQNISKIYDHYIGTIEDELFIVKSLSFPLMLHKHGELIERHPFNCNADGSFDFGASFHPGDRVQLGYGNPDKVIQAVQKMQLGMADFQPQGLFLSDCLARWFLLEGKMDSELKNCRQMAPSFGFYGYGEIMRRHNNMQMYNMTLVLAGLKEESTGSRSYVQFLPDHIPMTRNQRFLTHLVHLIDTTTSELEALNERLNHLANTDALTGLYNKGQLEDLLARALSSRERKARNFSLMMIDLDDFKNVNDHFGHDIGDYVLKSLSTVIKAQKRSTDVAGRWGGDEFMMMMETDGHGAKRVAERIKKSLALYALPDGNHITLSIGIAAALPGDTPETLFKRADQALYLAKNTLGKNAIIIKT